MGTVEILLLIQSLATLAKTLSEEDRQATEEELAVIGLRRENAMEAARAELDRRRREEG